MALWLIFFRNSGVKIERTYQLNTGGNTDFLKDAQRAARVKKYVENRGGSRLVIGARLADETVALVDYVPAEEPATRSVSSGWRGSSSLCAYGD